MEIRGIVETQQGTGTFVAERPSPGGAAERKKALERLVDELLAKAGSHGFQASRKWPTPSRLARPARGGGRRCSQPWSAAAAKKKAAEADEEPRSPLESKAERKQWDRDRAADSRRIVSEIGLLAFFLVLAAGGGSPPASPAPPSRWRSGSPSPSTCSSR